MVGSAVAGVLLFVAVVVGYLMHATSGGSGGSFKVPEALVAIAPPLVGEFRGTMGSFSGDFTHSNRNKVLAKGSGEIVGRITVDDKPRAGVRIRLALNGAVMSQWADSREDGTYAASVPFGEYRVDGYELDHASIRTHLAAKTDNPRNIGRMGGSFTVAEGKPGRGIDLDYVDPVAVTGPKGDVPAAGPIVVTWQPYPQAAAYRIQLDEFRRLGEYGEHRQVFEWSARPIVEGTSLDLKAAGAKLKPGFSYLAQIEALESAQLPRPISTSGNRFFTVDFRVVE